MASLTSVTGKGDWKTEIERMKERSVWEKCGENTTTTVYRFRLHKIPTQDVLNIEEWFRNKEIQVATVPETVIRGSVQRVLYTMLFLTQLGLEKLMQIGKEEETSSHMEKGKV